LVNDVLDLARIEATQMSIVPREAVIEELVDEAVYTARSLVEAQGYTLHFPSGSPQLNPQEHVWELTRDAVSHNHTRKDFPALLRTFHRYLEMTCFKFEWVEKYVPPILLVTYLVCPLVL
jgi:hypothetical protein